MFSSGGYVRKKKDSGSDDGEHKRRDSRRRSESRHGDGEHGTSSRPDSRRKHVHISSTDKKITFENMLASISSTQGNTLTKESVREMVESIYTWMVFDPNSQLAVPVEPGSSRKPRMWPHGAVVDSRKSGQAPPPDGDPRALERLADDVVSTVSTSVVSSIIEEEKLVGRTGAIVLDNGEGVGYHHAAPFSMQSRGYAAPSGRPDNFPPPAIQEAAEEPSVHQPQSVYRHAVSKANADGQQYIPRYSILGGPQPPVDVPVTPDNDKPRRTMRRRVPGRLKVDTAPIGAQGAGGGEAVTFVD